MCRAKRIMNKNKNKIPCEKIREENRNMTDLDASKEQESEIFEFKE